MQQTYRCTACGATYTGVRKRCSVCGTVGAETDRDSCWDCESWLDDSDRQQCPVCGSTDAEQCSVLPRG